MISTLAIVAERQRLAARGHDRQRAQILDRVAQLARITHVDRKTLQAFDGLADVLAADRDADDALGVGDRQSITRDARAVGHDLDVSAAGNAFGERRRGARHRAHRGLDVASDAFDHGEVGSRDLDARPAT